MRADALEAEQVINGRFTSDHLMPIAKQHMDAMHIPKMPAGIGYFMTKYQLEKKAGKVS